PGYCDPRPVYCNRGRLIATGGPFTATGAGLLRPARVAETVVRPQKAEGRMGLFDWFRKPKPAVPLPQLCYDVAYFILPHFAFRDLARLADPCLNTPTAAGPFFYAMAAQARKAEPDAEDAERFRWHHGQLG